MIEKILLVVIGSMILSGSVVNSENKEEPYKIYEEYKRIVGEDKDIALEIDRTILQQRELEDEIINLKFVKEREERILKQWKGKINGGGK